MPLLALLGLRCIDLLDEGTVRGMTGRCSALRVCNVAGANVLCDSRRIEAPAA